LLTLGWAAEYADTSIGFSCLWPQTYVATTAVSNSHNGEAMMAASRSPQIMADSALEILSRAPSDTTGQCLIDVDMLAQAGITDLSAYGGGPNPILDIFVDIDRDASGATADAMSGTSIG
jgi:hypothetical protein